MRVMIVGGGAREHALAWACSHDRGDIELICAPGNAGTAALATNVGVDVTDASAVAGIAAGRGIDLVVIGPDAAAAAGVADACAAAGVAVFGPSAAAARIESSKAFAKSLMNESGIPTPGWTAADAEGREKLGTFAKVFDGRCVVKADGLALGKGVTVCQSMAEVEAALSACFDQRRFGSAGSTVVIEERVDGRELSVLGLSDGRHVRVLVPTRDHKRAFDGDTGPNTGGMGAVAPAQELDAVAIARQVTESVLQPCVDSLAARGTPFVGCLYAGLMLTAAGVSVLEFNARFGDPEAQVMLPMLDEPLLELLVASTRGELEPGVARHRAGAAVGLVAAAAGYPGSPQTGDVITGTDSLDRGIHCFHAGTKRDAGGALRTAGGRVLTVVGIGEDQEVARGRAYDNLKRIRFRGMHFRSDIAQPATVPA